MSRITINVEFPAGTDIREAVAYAKEKARAWDVAYVNFKFNGVNFSIGRNADIDRVVSIYTSGVIPHNLIVAG